MDEPRDFELPRAERRDACNTDLILISFVVAFLVGVGCGVLGTVWWLL